MTPQIVLTMPLLEGLDGTQKMSKSLNNYVGIEEPAMQMFGKLMKISDDLMWRYFELLSFRTSESIAALQQEVVEGRNPRDVKFDLAIEIVTRFHSSQAAATAQQAFIDQFSHGAIPADIAEFELNGDVGGYGLIALMKDTGLTASTSEARRMIAQGAVKLDQVRVEDIDRTIAKGETVTVQVGKRRFGRVRIR